MNVKITVDRLLQKTYGHIPSELKRECRMILFGARFGADTRRKYFRDRLRAQEKRVKRLEREILLEEAREKEFEAQAEAASSSGPEAYYPVRIEEAAEAKTSNLVG